MSERRTSQLAAVTLHVRGSSATRLQVDEGSSLHASSHASLSHLSHSLSMETLVAM
eukprot:CAMPEP_0115889138 /NCGR_PEP_ID=MMETSP0287-20121206/32672_1 /TAXON_ID=412157 /ORGANISM="Chrysochromulina rotalis, Strain UIO044" /LENGTH=55 /DNA_ID=CAMNT_0003345851 /DNA_START=66 /DNA_END=233 /DNA_ORIENTATION=-